MNFHLLILGVFLAVTASATATETRHMRASTQTGAPIVATNKKKVPARRHEVKVTEPETITKNIEEAKRERIAAYVEKKGTQSRGGLGRTIYASALCYSFATA